MIDWINEKINVLQRRGTNQVPSSKLTKGKKMMIVGKQLIWSTGGN